MIKIEQTGGKLTEEEILHGKTMHMQSIRSIGKGKGENMLFCLLIL